MAPYDENNLKDSSSTAIVASALLELFWTLGKPERDELGHKRLRLVLAVSRRFEAKEIPSLIT